MRIGIGSFGILTGAILLLGAARPAAAEERAYDLVIEEKEVVVAGEPRRALTVNGSLPGPTLRFRVGDEAVVRVRNRLDVSTSVHWHGVLLPNPQDGVPWLTTPPIAPGAVHEFRFPIRHAGTYWYHSHTGLQEQKGVYGSLVFEPRDGEPIRADREQVLVLSDWTDESPSEVMRTLMRGSGWYSFRKGTRPSLAGAWSEGKLGDYLAAQWARMPPMDVSDVAYDAFLVNGRRSLDLDARPGETVRLRIINAAASTYFFLHGSPGPMTVIAADGPAVEPFPTDGILMAVAETYDLLVRVPPEGRWEIRATAQDGSGHASVFLGSGEDHPAREIPKPDLYSMRYLMAGAMESLADPEAGKGGTPRDGRPFPPYRSLRSADPVPPAEPSRVREIRMRLTGDMTRYLWSFDGRTLAEESTIRVREGETLRITLENDTMMHHPIHLHGHFFRLLDGDDAKAPLKHTVDIPPMGRRTMDVVADAPGDWFFHCHILYHMDAGMARVLSYGPEGHEPTLDPAMRGPTVFVGEATVLTNMTSGKAMVMHGREDLGVAWDAGWEHDRWGREPEYEADVYGEHFFDENLSAVLGGRFTNEEDANDRAFGGVSCRLPLLARGRLEADSRGDLRAGLAKDFQVTDRVGIVLSGHYDTGSRWEGRAGLDVLLTKSLSLAVEAHSDHGVGAGITIRF